MHNDPISNDDELPDDLSEEEIAHEIRAYYEPPPEPPKERPDEQPPPFGRVLVLGSERLRGLPVTLASLDPAGRDYIAVVGPFPPGQTRQYAAVFPRVPEDDYFVSCYVWFTQVTVWNGEDIVVDFAAERSRHARAAFA